MMFTGEDDDNGTASKYDLTKSYQHINVPSIISC